MRSLPVIDAYSHALQSTSNNLGFAWYVSWPWMAILAPILIAGNIYAALNVGDDPQNVPWQVGAVLLVQGVISAIAFASIAVNWHRFVLLDEVPKGADRLRLDNSIWRYFGNVILIALAVGVVATAIVLLAMLAGSILLPLAPFIMVVAFAALVLFAITAFYRLGIKLPAVALDRRDFGLSAAWKSSQGNGWRILGLAVLYFLTGLAAGLALWVVGAILGLAGGMFAVGLIAAAQLVANWVLSILGITLLTSLYGFFVENRNF